MARERYVNIQFPLGGVQKAVAYQSQPPYATPFAENVRPMDSLEGRARGGSRPGLSKAYPTELGGGNPVRMLSSLISVRDDGFRYWNDPFYGSVVGDRWITAPWIGSAPKILPEDPDALEEVPESALVLQAVEDFDGSRPYSLGIFILPWEYKHHGEYRLYARMNDAEPDVTEDGIAAHLLLEGENGAFSGTLRTYKAGEIQSTYDFSVTESPLGSYEGGWFILLIDSGDVVKVFWRDHELLSQDVSADLGVDAGHRVGFGMVANTAEDEDEVCVVDEFLIKYYTTLKEQKYRRQLIAVSNGLLYVENPLTGVMELADAENPLLVSDRNLQAAEWGQKLFIADHGEVKVEGVGEMAGTDLTCKEITDWTAHFIDPAADVVVVSNGTGTVVDGTYAIDSAWNHTDKLVLTKSIGTGTCTFRVEPGPKVYDPDTQKLDLWFTDIRPEGDAKGQIPTGCSLICRYADAIVLAGDRLDPHMWYMLRVGDPFDADYFSDPHDPTRAVSGLNAEAGRVGEPITCLVPFHDDYLLMGGTDSLHVMRGHPAYDGKIDILSHIAGVVSGTSWCFGPQGEVIFLSRDGLYIMGAGAAAMPERFSRERLPRELLNVDPSLFEITMAYDVRDHGIHLFITPKVSQGNRQQAHWWIDWKTKSFYTVRLNAAHEPFSCLRYQTTRLEESRVILGGRDGYLRSYRSTNTTDDGLPITSRVILGPVRLGRVEDEDGKLLQITGVLDRKSGHVTCAVMTGDSPEACIQGVAKETYSWRGGVGTVNRPGLQGACFALGLISTQRWAMESIPARFVTWGPHRR